MFQDLDCSPLQQDHYHCQQLTLSLSLLPIASSLQSLSVTHSQTHNPLCVSVFLSFIPQRWFISFLPLSSSSSSTPQPPSGSAPSSITLSGFLIPTLETPVPIQENNRLKKRIQSPEYLPFLCLCLCLPPSSPQISGKINSGEAKPELRGKSSTQGWQGSFQHGG